MSKHISDLAHCAHTLNRLALRYEKLAIKYPRHAAEHLDQARRKRQSARWYLNRAREAKAWAEYNSEAA